MSNIAGDARHPFRYSLQTDPSTLLLPLPYSSRHWLAMTLLRGSCRTTANGSRDNINLNKNRQGWFLFVIRCSALYYSSVFIMLSSTSSCPFFILYKDLHPLKGPSLITEENNNNEILPVKLISQLHHLQHNHPPPFVIPSSHNQDFLPLHFSWPFI